MEIWLNKFGSMVLWRWLNIWSNFVFPYFFLDANGRDDEHHQQFKGVFHQRHGAGDDELEENENQRGKHKDGFAVRFLSENLYKAENQYYGKRKLDDLHDKLPWS